MSWHDDKQRHLDNQSARDVREQRDIERKKTAKRLYEAGVTRDEITQRAKVGTDTLAKWIREGGWKRDT